MSTMPNPADFMRAASTQEVDEVCAAELATLSRATQQFRAGEASVVEVLAAATSAAGALQAELDRAAS